MTVLSITPDNAFLPTNDARTASVLHIGGGNVTLSSGNVYSYSPSWWGPFVSSYGDNLAQVYLDSNGNMQSRPVTAANQNSFPANSVPLAIVKTDAITSRIQAVTDVRAQSNLFVNPIPASNVGFLGLW